MKTLDLICAKLKSQSVDDPKNFIVEPTPVQENGKTIISSDDSPNPHNEISCSPSIIDEEIGDNDLPSCSSTRAKNSSSPNGNRNKRKNFTPLNAREVKLSKMAPKNGESLKNLKPLEIKNEESVIDDDQCPKVDWAEIEQYTKFIQNFMNVAEVYDESSNQMTVESENGDSETGLNSLSSGSFQNLFIDNNVRNSDGTPFPLSKTKNGLKSQRPDSEKPGEKISKSLMEAYIVRFFGPHCGADQCSNLISKEHFHCKRCRFRLFTKKDDMLRHYKWHRKREDSMAQGFLRFSAMDNCSEEYDNCIHNLRQTHYHCLHENCGKVYVSTSDVQMHANSHRKADSIQKEGFRRFKTNEDCRSIDCPFQSLRNRTTHFHCLRQGCRHTFKNKADMDKHKTHHQRDDLFFKDGFKKFMKCENCIFPGCAFSRVVNHTHCLRPGCSQILQSTGQVYAHKRKHDRLDRRHGRLPTDSDTPTPGNSTTAPSNPPNLGTPELALRENDSLLSIGGVDSDESQQPIGEGLFPTIPKTLFPEPCDLNKSNDSSTMQKEEKDNNKPPQDEDESIDMHSLQQPISILQKMQQECKDDSLQETSGDFKSKENVDTKSDKEPSKMIEDFWKKYIIRFTANDQCVAYCGLMYKDHYHCVAGDGCKAIFKSKDGVRDHAKQHELLTSASSHFESFRKNRLCSKLDCPLSNKEDHYHCTMHGCNEVITSNESVFRRLEHHKLHEYANALKMSPDTLAQQSADIVAAASSIMPSFGNLPNFVQQLPAAALFLNGGLFPKHFQNQIFDDSNMPIKKRGRPPKNFGPDWTTAPLLNAAPFFAQNFFTNGNFHLPFDLSQNHYSNNNHNMQPTKRGRPRTVSSPKHFDFPKIEADNGANSSSNSPQPEEPKQSNFQSLPPPTSMVLMDRFLIFDQSQRCPNAQCYLLRTLHYHCAQKSCFFASPANLLEAHVHDFHATFDLPDGFACYDKNYDCPAQEKCQYNGTTSRHFHCLRNECKFEAFNKFNRLFEHNEANHIRMQLPLKSMHKDPSQLISTSPQPQFNKNDILDHLDNKIRLIKTSRNFIVDPKEQKCEVNNGGPGLLVSSEMGKNGHKFATSEKSIQNVTSFTTTAGKQCGRPFCKLKRRQHFHCALCDCGFSLFSRLTTHMMKHGVTVSGGRPLGFQNNNGDATTGPMQQIDDVPCSSISSHNINNNTASSFPLKITSSIDNNHMNHKTNQSSSSNPFSLKLTDNGRLKSMKNGGSEILLKNGKKCSFKRNNGKVTAKIEIDFIDNHDLSTMVNGAAAANHLFLKSISPEPS